MKKGANRVAPEKGTPPSLTEGRDGTLAPVCITGMHRSGTSMVARILGACGLDLGPPEELIGPRPDNPDGFFENVNFVLLNDDILQAFGGAWDAPPDLPSGWTSDPRLERIRRNAGALTTSWASRLPWGWKDPRCSLTLPFWNELLPNLRVVVCLRHPLDVHHSLESRGYASRVFAVGLWRRYNESLLAAVSRERRIVTHYDAYFFNPEDEIRRVLSALGLGASTTTIADAARLVSGAMRHHGSSGDEKGGKPLPKEVLALYGALADEAGEVFRAAPDAAASHPAEDVDKSSSADGDARRDLAALRDELSTTLRDLASARERLEAAERELASLSAEHESALGELRGLQSSVAAAGQVVQELRATLSRKAQERMALEDAHRATRQELNEARAALSGETQERLALEDVHRATRQELDEVRAELSREAQQKGRLSQALCEARDDMAELQRAKSRFEIGCSAAEAALKSAHEDEQRLLRSLAKSRRELENLSSLRVKVDELETIRVAQERRLARFGAQYSHLLRLVDSKERGLAAARAEVAERWASAGAAATLSPGDDAERSAAQTIGPDAKNDGPRASSSVTLSGSGRPSVLFVSHDAHPHGAQIFILQFLEWLRKNSDISIEILLGREGALAERFAAVGRTSVWPDGIRGAAPLPEGDPLMRRFREAGVSLVYSNTIVNGRILAGLSRLGGDVISHPHELGYWMQNRLPEGDLRLALDLTNHFVACSRAVRRSLVESLGVPSERVSVVHEFIPVGTGEKSLGGSGRSLVREELGAGSDARVVCGSGTTDWRKAPDLFVQVARLVKERLRGRDIHFIWVGGDARGTEFTQLRHDVEKSGLGGVVHFLGHRPNPRYYFAASDVFILPSREDPFPLVNLEAAAEGVPIVCFDEAGGSKEFVEDDCGFVVPYLDVEAMAGGVVEILTTPGLKERLGRRAAEKVRERHDIEVVAPKLLELIETRLGKAAESRA